MDLYSWASVLEDVVGKYSTPAATFWLICTSFRLFTVVQVVIDTYGNEYSFDCAAAVKDNVGCKNQCYMHYAPISLASFWTLSMFTLMAPFLFFNTLLKWINLRNEINAEKNVAPSFMTRTMSITRKRKGRPKEQIWCPLIALGLVVKKSLSNIFFIF
ncbi:Oidioi.mRNA.OKI2018_I69.chr2.g6833.t1.cds [Oikopleura dioica]|uniref:Oidioi.mRNA.OKI2018_I69.chr2.g6833.t1.cds n=1 Tax=Oikopleura dioica TaxID=34765 RepID=A0ABN7T593_OIKDI|nr:Oidioi.mRNA.OKI2018_I69.chr2.g6833.t1.cds [Oikopleura dioica]